MGHQEAERLGRPLRVLDPFAGVGRPRLEAALGSAAAHVLGVELEAEWREGDPLTVPGDATDLDPTWTGAWDLVATSPSYANRMADCHEAKDPCGSCKGSGCTVADCLGGHPDDGQDHRLCPGCGGSGLSKRHTYRHYLGRMPSHHSGSVLQWVQPGYRFLHAVTCREMARVVRRGVAAHLVDGVGVPEVPGGLLVVNMANHYRTLETGGPQLEQRVVEWWVGALLAQGLGLVEVRRVPTPRHRHGENWDARVDGEVVIVMRSPALAPAPPNLFGG